MARTVIDTLSYAECARRFNPRRANRLAPNTWLEQLPWFGELLYVVRFHSTYILSFKPDGSVAYSTGGHRTATTKERLNRFGPARVHQRKGEWYVDGDRWVGDTFLFQTPDARRLLLKDLGDTTDFAPLIPDGAAPEDRHAWLVLADWMDERNDPRADMVRVFAHNTIQ